MAAQGGQSLIGGLRVNVHRNYFGSQLQSFEAELPTPRLRRDASGSEPARAPALFIRAPAVLGCHPDVTVLAKLPVPERPEREVIVAVEEVRRALPAVRQA